MPNILKTRLLTLILLTSIVFFSCKKENNTIGVIIVKDSSGDPVRGARVVLHSNPVKGEIYDYYDDIDEDGEYDRDLEELIREEMDTIINQFTGQTTHIFESESTDSGGRVEFNLPLAMILNVTVLKVDGNKEHLGANIINIEQNKTKTQVVRLTSYDSGN